MFRTNSCAGNVLWVWCTCVLFGSLSFESREQNVSEDEQDCNLLTDWLRLHLESQLKSFLLRVGSSGCFCKFSVNESNISWKTTNLAFCQSLCQLLTENPDCHSQYVTKNFDNKRTSQLIYTWSPVLALTPLPLSVQSTMGIFTLDPLHSEVDTGFGFKEAVNAESCLFIYFNFIFPLLTFFLTSTELEEILT